MEKITNQNFQEIIKNKDIFNMHFIWIDFSGENFSLKNFSDCKIEKCNLSNISIKNTTFNNVYFIKSKIMWLDFTLINTILSNFNFLNCNIDLCSFNQMILKNINFEDSFIKECNFSKTNLENSNFSYCNLEKTIFNQTNLKNANLIGSSNFYIDPNLNNLEKTKFSRENAILLLSSLNIIIEW